MYSGELASFSPQGTYIAFVDSGVLKVERLEEKRPPGKERLTKLFRDLDSNQFQTRHTAYIELKKLGHAISSDIDQQLQADISLEVQYRLEALKHGLERTEKFRHKRRIRQLAFSPDEEFLALGGDDRVVSLWRASSAQHERTLARFDSSIHALCFSPDGRWLAVGSGSGKIVVLDLQRAGGSQNFIGHTSSVHALAFSGDGTRMFSAGGFDQRIGMWDTSNLADIRRDVGHLTGWIGKHKDSVLAVAISKSGRFVASAGYEKTVRLWDLQASELAAALTTQQDTVRCMMFFDNDARILTAADDGFVRIWNRREETLIHSFSSQVGSVRSVSLHPSGSQLAVSGSERRTTIWNFKQVLERTRFSQSQPAPKP